MGGWITVTPSSACGTSSVNLNKLQRVQNSFARIVRRTKRSEHITPIPAELHWLPVKYRIDFKVAVITYKVLTSKEPRLASSGPMFRHVACAPATEICCTRIGSTSSWLIAHPLSLHLQSGTACFKTLFLICQISQLLSDC